MAMIGSIFGGNLMPAVASFMNSNDGRTNPNARAGKKGKNAKSNKAAQRRQLQSEEADRALIRDIFDRTGATRRTMSGQIERDVPQGLDFFKTTGPNRAEVQARQKALDAGGLNRPSVWQQAQQAVNDTKRAQGWLNPTTPPKQAGPSMDQILRTPTRTVDVFQNPVANVTNPRTGLVTNQGEFTRSMEGPYGRGSAVFQPQGDVTVGPVQEMFNQPAQTASPAAMPGVFNQAQASALQPGFTPEQWMQAQPDQGPNYVAGLDWLLNMFASPEPPKTTVNQTTPFQFEPF